MIVELANPVITGFWLAVGFSIAGIVCLFLTCLFVAIIRILNR